MGVVVTVRKTTIRISFDRFDMEAFKTKILRVFGGEILGALIRNSPVKGGYLKQHWHEEFTDDQFIIGNNTSYLPYVIRGTGTYGPEKRPICASGYLAGVKTPPGMRRKREKPTCSKNPGPAVPGMPQALRWCSNGQVVFRRCVQGQRPNPFVQNSIREGIEKAVAALRSLVEHGGGIT